MTHFRFLPLLLLTALPLSAQWDAARHPLYDVTTPTEEQAKKAPKATELILGENADWRVTTTDKRFITSFPANAYHDGKDDTLWLNGWRGERVSTQLIVSPNGAAKNVRVTCTPLRCRHDAGKEMLPELRMVRYTLAHGVPTADIIGNESTCDNADGVPRPVWLQLDIPREAAAGCYEGELTATAEGCEPVRKRICVEVEDAALPEPKDWRIHVDFWQHPDAVARWHDVEPWSEAHFALMRPLMKRLADAGQKVVTCAIIDEAWNGQTYDWFPSQIRWIQGADGMRYDYTIFDKWVSFMREDIGIQEEIFCYTMVPWSMEIRYLDETSGENRTLALDHKDPSYERIWGHFLADFREHLREKGWLENTSVALDERPDDLIRATKDIIARYAPELKVISSVNTPSAESADIHLVSPILQHTDSISKELLARRKARGQKTIFYTCLSPKKPNSFTFSPPAESEWLGLFAAAHELDGYSRWAYNSWNKNPFETTDFVHWPSGDCFMVYPGNLSSIRFERLRDGFEDYEKIRLLRERAARINSLAVQEAINELDTWLKTMFTIERSTKNYHDSDVAEAYGYISHTLQVILEAENDRRLMGAVEKIRKGDIKEPGEEDENADE